eukprot:7034902-Pyramimonas_sp.AAC.1
MALPAWERHHANWWHIASFWLSGQFALGWLAASLADWWSSTGWLCSWLVGWLAGLRVCRLVAWLVGCARLSGLLVGRFTALVG